MSRSDEHSMLPADSSTCILEALNLLDPFLNHQDSRLEDFQAPGGSDTTSSPDPTVAMNAATVQFERKTSSNTSGTRNLGVFQSSISTYHTPEPPTIHVPPAVDRIFPPTFEGICADDITDADLRVITQTEFEPVDNSTRWRYEMRRNAQRILPFLYLGPWETLKTQMDYLQREEISLLLVVRDTATARAGIMNPKKYAEAMGIMYDSIDVKDNQELIMAFPHAVNVINNHLLNCYRQQIRTTGGNFGPGQSPFRMGKVFLFCESGNDRSAAIAVAYVLAMYKVSLLYSLQFIQAQRFCISIDEPMKHLLSAYEDILKAQRDVHNAHKHMQAAQKQPAHASCQTLGSPMPNVIPRPTNSAPKRGRSVDNGNEMVDDEERFLGRSVFQPFVQQT